MVNGEAGKGDRNRLSGKEREEYARNWLSIFGHRKQKERQDEQDKLAKDRQSKIPKGIKKRPKDV